ncbi:hypothetical protein [Candidatus Burkholderia verschuerenii]|uniref:hypothetical protein n=1 Tax=Candidatus Burkholderia verschuerenii TaxID=242163 RepID=UPI000AE949A1|nr:hypothetical protein [Candidatus Burkholderia verschuerenii]
MEREATADERAGIAWWNALDEQARRFWMSEAGQTGRAVDAWEAFKRAREAAQAPGD